MKPLQFDDESPFLFASLRRGRAELTRESAPDPVDFAECFALAAVLSSVRDPALFLGERDFVELSCWRC